MSQKFHIHQSVFQRRKTGSLRCSLFSISSSNCLRNQKQYGKEHRHKVISATLKGQKVVCSLGTDFSVTETELNHLEVKDFKPNLIGITYQPQQRQQNQYKMPR